MKTIVIITGLFLAIAAHAQEVKWYTFEEAVELNKTHPKKILIDVYTDWCGWCKVMDKNTFSNDVIATYLNGSFYPVKFNAEQKEDVLLNGHTYHFVNQGARGYHELAAALLNNQMSYPAVVFLNEQIQIIHVQKGYVKPQPFDEILKFIGGEHYLTSSWEEWQASYQSPIAE